MQALRQQTGLPVQLCTPATRSVRPTCAPGRAQQHMVPTRATTAEQATAPARAASAHPSAATLRALKEWAPTCAAIAAGEQTILLRKGGIKEPTFKPEAREFVLFPTSFHTEAELLKPAAAQRYAADVRYDPRAQPQLSFSTVAAVTGAWTTFAAPEVLQLLDELHIWAPRFLENRLRWRERQPITVLELRAYRLQTPLILPARDEFWGCFSWVDLGSSQQLGSQPELAATGTPALDDEAFAAKQQLCWKQLAHLADLQELVI